MMNQHVILDTSQKLNNQNIYSLTYSWKKTEIHQMQMLMITKRRARIRIMNKARAKATIKNRPLYAFGHGLTYANFDYSNFKVSGGESITATFSVTNTGNRHGADVSQLYLTQAAGEDRMRLLGFERVELQLGESHSVTMSTDTRLLARYDGESRNNK